MVANQGQSLATKSRSPAGAPTSGTLVDPSEGPVVLPLVPVGSPSLVSPEAPHVPNTRLSARIRRAPQQPVSLAQHRLAAGQSIVPAEGNSVPRYLRFKRVFDVAGALGLVVLLAPVMLLTFLALWVTTRGQPIFRQVRLGYRGRPFPMYKFRTMALNAAQRQHEVANEKEGPIFKNPRVTPIGRFLRTFSIDEMPQLFNVIAGQMSLVGPRPPLASEVAEYEPWQRRRLAVKPGLTCLWQVSGRSEIAFDDWVRMDLWYVRNQNLLVDLKLLAKTPVSVLSGRGAY